MKKIIGIILAAVCLCACGKEETVVEPLKEETSAAIEAVVEQEEYITWNEKELVFQGLEREYEIWFLADSHITLCNSNESEEIKEYSKQRTPGFANDLGVSSDLIFSQFVDAANE